MVIFCWFFLFLEDVHRRNALFYARFERKTPTTIPLPEEALMSLNALRQWGHEQIGADKNAKEFWGCRLENAKTFNIFIRTNRSVGWNRIDNEMIFGKLTNDANLGKFYFTMATSPSNFPEALSTTELTSGWSEIIKNFVSKLGQEITCTDRDADSCLAKAIGSVLDEGHVIVLDEIQENTALITKILVAMDERTAHRQIKNQANTLRLVYLGTPDVRWSDQPLDYLSPNIINKAGVEIFLQSFLPSEFMELVSQVVGEIAIKEILALWAITGGNGRKLRTFLATCPPSGSPPVFDRSAMCTFLKDSLKVIHRDIGSADWDVLLDAASKSTKGLTVPPATKGKIETLFCRGHLVEMEDKIDGKIKTEKFGLNDSFIESLVRYKKGESPEGQIAQLSGFAFENFLTRLLSEKDPWKMRSIAFGAYDIDIVRADKVDGKYKISLFSLKLSESEMLGSGVHFCKENVRRFLDHKVESAQVSQVEVVGVIGDPAYQDEATIAAEFQSGINFLMEKYSIEFSFLLKTLDEYMAETRKQKVAAVWPYIHRKEFETKLSTNLASGKLSTLVRGYAGVGKSVSVRTVVEEWVAKTEKKYFWIPLSDVKSF